MPTMKLYQNGTSTYMGGVGSHIRAKRGEVVGWSKAAARRQTRWLWSVNSGDLSGFGYAVTLTLRDTPESAVEFHALRHAYLKRLERMGTIRVHWVMEFQERGAPHLHMAVYFDRELSEVDFGMLAVHWMQVGRIFGVDFWAQDVKEIRGDLGWLKYLAKHASRGVYHYQRSGHPDGWDKTGRLWGVGGAWPVVEPVVFEELNNREFYRVRRLMRAWAYADARKVGDSRRMQFLRRSWSTSSSKESRYLGAAEWIPEHVALRLVEFLMNEN